MEVCNASPAADRLTNHSKPRRYSGTSCCHQEHFELLHALFVHAQLWQRRARPVPPGSSLDALGGSSRLAHYGWVVLKKKKMKK